MAIATPEDGTLDLNDAPDESPSDTAPGLLPHLRAAWATYRAENRRRWDEMVNEQAKDPSLD